MLMQLPKVRVLPIIVSGHNRIALGKEIVA